MMLAEVATAAEPAAPLDQVNPLLDPYRGPTVATQATYLGHQLVTGTGEQISLAAAYDTYMRAMRELPRLARLNAHDPVFFYGFRHLVHVLGVYVKVAYHFGLARFRPPAPAFLWPFVSDLLGNAYAGTMTTLVKQAPEYVAGLDLLLATDVADALGVPYKAKPRRSRPQRPQPTLLID
jgi:hypothetical protein